MFFAKSDAKLHIIYYIGKEKSTLLCFFMIVYQRKVQKQKQEGLRRGATPQSILDYRSSDP